jgi:sigma-E factor negative regulatory protein RseB
MRPGRSGPNNSMIQAMPKAATCLLVSLAATIALAQERSSPGEWLQDMSRVVEELDYEGTVVRHKNGQSEAIKIIHKIVDGVINERLVYQEGNGLEIIRFGNEVHCVLPDKKSVLIETWNEQSTLFSALPHSDSQYGAQYHTSVVREERVAGRNAVQVAIRPHDEYRYGHRLWLDQDTAFPLRSDIVDNDGVLIEQVKFAEISLGKQISAKALHSNFDLQSFTWYSEGARSKVEDVDSDWSCEDLPPGFRLVSSTNTQFPGSENAVTHIMYSDGLAKVSVFVGEKGEKSIAERSSVGASSSYSTELDGYQITAIGEVPEITVQRIAQSMQSQLQ